MSPFLNSPGRLNFYISSALAIGIAFLGGCSSSKIILTSTNQNPAETAIPSTTEPPITVVPSLTAVPFPTTTLHISESIVKFQRFEITSGAALAANPMGALAVCGDSTIQLLRFVPEMKVETILVTTSEPLCDGTSPDGKWIAYEQDSEDSPTGSWLGVVSADGQQQKKIPMDSHWIYFGDYTWLDNQHLIFNNFINPPDVQRLRANPAYPMVAVNPFTGEHIELPSNYPGLNLGICGPAGAMAFDYSDVVYDPSLDLVIFPTWGGTHNYIILWSRRSQAILAKIEDQSGCFRYPLWSPDATQFAVPVVYAVKDGHSIDEWYLVNREGQAEQLTNFGDYFSSSEIGSASNWSSNGQKLAFWIEVSPSLCPGLNLAVLNIDTKQVTDTCIPGSSDYAPPPIWSLDSRYIVVVNARTEPRQTILVDTEGDRAFDITNITGASRPIGWLVSP